MILLKKMTSASLFIHVMWLSNELNYQVEYDKLSPIWVSLLSSLLTQYSIGTTKTLTYDLVWMNLVSLQYLIHHTYTVITGPNIPLPTHSL